VKEQIAFQIHSGLGPPEITLWLLLSMSYRHALLLYGVLARAEALMDFH